MDGLQRPGALYKQVAAAIRDAITTGEFEPGTLLPSETQLIERYHVSRPTVRNAIAALRTEGLIEVIHGKGSFVRGRPSASATVDRTVTRDADGAYSTGLQGWELAEAPSIYRTHTTAETAPLLGLDEDEALFGIDRLYVDPATGTRLAYRMLLPFATAEGTKLAEHPDAESANVYAILEAAGHNLTWVEYAAARMPLPDERTALQLPDATPVLHTTRVTHGTDDRPLLLEELRTSGERARTAYRITTDSPRHLTPVRD
ncbi:GntR family transcriptional regulator [Streptomyces aculeolatus]|uniref:GntR family transcriptional regulator n=1 Tax=Streptomyces aculeolatus TaxID=270689 RepID=UPI001CED5FC0|nr:GntR family transcriptional regulator [Streptomyces aculeolatus]